MSLVVEVSPVVLALEVLYAEFFVVDVDKTLRSHDELDRILFTGFGYIPYHISECLLIQLPRRNETDFCPRIILLDTLQKQIQTLLEDIYRIRHE